MKIVHPLNFVEHFAHVTNTRTQFQFFTIVHVISRMRSSLKGVVKGAWLSYLCSRQQKTKHEHGGLLLEERQRCRRGERERNGREAEKKDR